MATSGTCAAALSSARPSRPSSERAFGGTPVGTRCWRSTSSPGASYRGRVRDDGSLERVRVYQLPGTVGMIAPVEGDDGWLLGAGRSFVYLAPDGTHRTIAEVAPAGTRMNDGACDPQGRFWGGTLADDHHEGGGALYRLERDGSTELYARRSDDLQRTGLEPGRARRCISWTAARG